MASTITLASTINWSKFLIKQMPLNVGNYNEPGISNANIILQTILGPPFAWRWNRKTTSGSLSQGTQTVTINIADYGFVEKAAVNSAAGTFELELQNIVSRDSVSGRPRYLSPESDDGAGNVTFRVIPVPDGAYTLYLTYQAKPTLFTSLAQTWAPMPDEYSYIYNSGFLALSMLYTDDPRFQVINQKFIASLLGASEGLSEMQKNIFVGNWNVATDAMKAQQGMLMRQNQ